jgi:hypothetical protein
VLKYILASIKPIQIILQSNYWHSLSLKKLDQFNLLSQIPNLAASQILQSYPIDLLINLIANIPQKLIPQFVEIRKGLLFIRSTDHSDEYILHNQINWLSLNLLLNHMLNSSVGD